VTISILHETSRGRRVFPGRLFGYGITMTDVRFKNQAGQVLFGRLFFPQGDSAGLFPVVVFAHGFDSGKDSPRGMAVANRLLELGIATFLFDFTGHGESEGSKAESTIDRQVQDLRAAVDVVSGVLGVDASRIGVNGASSGGLVALTEAKDDARVKAISLRGPRTDGMRAYADRFTMPVFIAQGEYDPLLDETRGFFAALAGPKVLEVIGGADHLFSDPTHLDEVKELTGRWFAGVFKQESREQAA